MFFVFGFIFSAASAFTVPCPSSGARANVSLLRKVAIIAEESRLQFGEYAKLKGLPEVTVQKEFSATGRINCGGAFGTAQVTGVNNVITTAGHVFYDSTCAKLNFKKPCVFEMVTPPYESVNLDMNSVIASCRPGISEEDWAVARLERPPNQVTPYAIPSDDRFLVADDDTRVTQVSAHSFNFKVGNSHPPHIQQCRITQSWPKSGIPLATDCDNGGWSSGSAQLVGEFGSFTLAAIVVSQLHNAVDGEPFDRDKNFNVSVPVAGEFLKAIRKTMRR